MVVGRLVLGRLVGRVDGRVEGLVGWTDGRVLGRVDGRVEGLVGWVDGRVPTPLLGRVLGLPILLSSFDPDGRLLVSSLDGAPPLLGNRLSWLLPILLQLPPLLCCQLPDFGSSLCTLPLRPT